MIIDGTDLLLGRLSSFIAKKALLGQNIDIVNCEKLVISGDRRHIIEEYKRRAKMGIPAKGPFIYKHPEKFVKRTIRGMLPHKIQRGREALSRIKCYLGVPDEFKEKELITLKQLHHKKLSNSRFVSVYEICKELGLK